VLLAQQRERSELSSNSTPFRRRTMALRELQAPSPIPIELPCSNGWGMGRLIYPPGCSPALAATSSIELQPCNRVAMDFDFENFELDYNKSFCSAGSPSPPRRE